jgi:hypothetical protein
VAKGSQDKPAANKERMKVDNKKQPRVSDQRPLGQTCHIHHIAKVTDATASLRVNGQLQALTPTKDNAPAAVLTAGSSWLLVAVHQCRREPDAKDVPFTVETE